MISQTYANKLLNHLAKGTGISEMESIYLGLCLSEPDATGDLTNAGEPTFATNDTNSTNYQRVSVEEPDKFGSANEGEITTIQDIQFPSAKMDWGELNYWFLSTSLTAKSAYLWGRIKDIALEKKTYSFSVEALNITSASTTDSVILGLSAGTQYLVEWDGKEWELEATVYENEGTQYILLGSESLVEGVTDVNMPFAILYKTATEEDGITVYSDIKFYAYSSELQHEIAIYSYGINVRKSTVPTFYKGQLTISIDAQ